MYLGATNTGERGRGGWLCGSGRACGEAPCIDLERRPEILGRSGDGCGAICISTYRTMLAAPEMPPVVVVQYVRSSPDAPESADGFTRRRVPSHRPIVSGVGAHTHELSDSCQR
jgi:hypothetical protein